MKAQKEAHEKALADMRRSHEATLDKMTQALLTKTQLVMDYQVTMDKVAISSVTHRDVQEGGTLY